MEQENVLRVAVEDVTIEELGEIAGAGPADCASTVSTVSTPLSIGTAATIGVAK